MKVRVACCIAVIGVAVAPTGAQQPAAPPTSAAPFYTGNFLNGSIKGKGATYAQYTRLCLETQKFPNAINVPAWREQVILRPGQTYRHVMIHAFSMN